MSKLSSQNGNDRKVIHLQDVKCYVEVLRNHLQETSQIDVSTDFRYCLIRACAFCDLAVSSVDEMLGRLYVPAEGVEDGKL